MSETHSINNAMENSRTRPRLYVPAPLMLGQEVTLSQDQAHYVRHVMRQDVGATLRLFNQGGGEFLGTIIAADKKHVSLRLTDHLRLPDATSARRVLLFSLVKKDALDTILVKATELGVTDIQPVLTARSVVRALNDRRAMDQVTEAAEQSERLNPPVIHPVRTLKEAVGVWTKEMPVFACLETLAGGDMALPQVTGDAAILIGPEGGFTQEEQVMLTGHADVWPLSLGQTILRADTACLVALTLLTLAQEGN